MTRRFVPLVFLAACSLLVIGYINAETSGVLGPLCNNSPVVLESVHQTRHLIEQVKKSNSLSCSAYRDSLVDLDELLAVVQSGETPNMDFIKMVQSYHEKYIADEHNQIKSNIPVALRQFFISLCFQISAEFKINLINNLELDSKQFIEQTDYDLIGVLDEFGATLSDSESEINDFDDLIVVEDLNRAAGLEQQRETKLMIKVKTSEFLRKLIRTCNNKFKPIYDKLILPLIGLSNMGYNYQGELLKVELEELKRNPLAKRWYVIVQTCETFKTIDIYEASESFTEDDRQAFVFIQRDEAEELRKNQKALLYNESEEPIDYHPKASHNDQLWITDQKELQKLVSKYRASATEADRIRHKLLKKLMNRFVDSLRSGKLVFFTSEMIKNGLSSRKSVSNVNEELITMIDDVAATADSTPLISQIDRPVAGAPTKRTFTPLYPVRQARIPKKENGTKLTTKLHDFTVGRLMPSKWNIFFWLIGIIGSLMILAGIFLLAVSTVAG